MNKYIIIFCILSGCETLLPPENRTYINTVRLADGENLGVGSRQSRKFILINSFCGSIRTQSTLSNITAGKVFPQVPIWSAAFSFAQKRTIL